MPALPGLLIGSDSIWTINKWKEKNRILVWSQKAKSLRTQTSPRLGDVSCLRARAKTRPLVDVSGVKGAVYTLDQFPCKILEHWVTQPIPWTLSSHNFYKYFLFTEIFIIFFLIVYTLRLVLSVFFFVHILLRRLVWVHRQHSTTWEASRTSSPSL